MIAGRRFCAAIVVLHGSSKRPAAGQGAMSFQDR
jgi:hypothetical protein